MWSPPPTTSPPKRPVLRKQNPVSRPTHLDLSEMIFGDSRVPAKHYDIDDLTPSRPTIRAFPDFAESHSTSCQVDYTVPHPSRPLEVKIQGRSLYVDPELLNDVSPMLTAFLVREMVAGKRKAVEVQLEDVEYDDMLKVLDAVCPTEFGLFPKPITEDTYVLMAKLAKKFKISKLKEACELFIAKAPLPEMTLEKCVWFLNVACKCGLNNDSRIRLVEGAVGNCTDNKLRISLDPGIDPFIRSLIQKAVELNRTCFLNHSAFEVKAKLMIPCRTCRAPSSPSGRDRFVVCVDCKSTVCGKCIRKPCAMRNFGTDFTLQQLEALFAPCGKIASATVAKNERGQSKGFGFVAFDTREATEEAIRRHNGAVTAEGKKLFVGPFKKKEERQADVRQQQTMRLAPPPTVFVNGLSAETTDEKINEVFAEYGTIRYVKRPQLNKHKAFVIYERHSEMLESVRRARGRMIDEKRIYVNFAHPSRTAASGESSLPPMPPPPQDQKR